MKEKHKRFSSSISNIIFFLLGALTVFFILNYRNIFVLSQSNNEITDEEEVTSTPTPKVYVNRYIEITPTIYISSALKAKKYTVEEAEKIRADKTEAQTGETVNFSVTVKNTGVEKKFLTHLCFNYTGGNFGCVRNVNIAAGDLLNVNNSMMFKDPGVQTVWVTWSQDGQNFYRPANSGTVNVSVI